MRRGILLVSILLAGMILIVSAAMLSYIFRHSDTKGLNIINSTGGRWTSTPTKYANTAALEESKNIGTIANVPNKCLGSALCQD